MQCDSQSLATNAASIHNSIPDGMKMAVMISLLCQLANVNCDPQSLVNNATCQLSCLSGDLQGAIVIYLLCQIANSGGGGGGGGGLSGVGSPQGVVSASPGSTYLQTDTGSFWAKQTGTDANGWLELIV